MSQSGRNTCQRAALVGALVSLISAMMLPGLSLSRAAGLVHFTETSEGGLLVCLNSLPVSAAK
jgi:hypothetical protein